MWNPRIESRDTAFFLGTSLILCHPTHHQVSTRVGLCALWSSHLILSREGEYAVAVCACECVQRFRLCVYNILWRQNGDFISLKLWQKSVSQIHRMPNVIYMRNVYIHITVPSMTTPPTMANRILLFMNYFSKGIYEMSNRKYPISQRPTATVTHSNYNYSDIVFSFFSLTIIARQKYNKFI